MNIDNNSSIHTSIAQAPGTLTKDTTSSLNDLSQTQTQTEAFAEKAKALFFKDGNWQCPKEMSEAQQKQMEEMTSEAVELIKSHAQFNEKSATEKLQEMKSDLDELLDAKKKHKAAIKERMAADWGKDEDGKLEKEEELDCLAEMLASGAGSTLGGCCGFRQPSIAFIAEMIREDLKDGIAQLEKVITFQQDPKSLASSEGQTPLIEVCIALTALSESSILKLTP